MNESNLKHLEFIQNVITRMNTNSFQIKNWAVTLSSALLAIYSSTNNINFFYISALPIITFWSLDAYYLQQERKYRALFDDVVNFIDSSNPIPVFTMDTRKYVNGRYSYFNCFISRTLRKTYFFMSLLVIFAYFVI
ncbi:TPA: hypothetical protein ACF5B0_004320 [Vibrio parahaemolyticus]